MSEEPTSHQELQTANEERRQFITWLWRLPVIATLGGAGYASWRLYKHFDKTKPVTNPSFSSAQAIKISDFSELEELWTTLEFAIDGVPAIAIHVPEAIPGGLTHQTKHYIAFSRICTHQGCLVLPNRNFEAIAVSYNYRTTSPVLACGCHFSIFDISKAGEAVSGPANLPLPRIKLEPRENSLYAVGIEQESS